MKQVDYHGGNIHAARRSARVNGRDILDCSASINPLGPSPKVMAVLKLKIHEVIHYPDPDCEELCQALAHRYHVSRSQVVMGNGSNELIYHLPQALGIAQALIIGPTFSEYARAVTLNGGSVTCLHAKAAEQFVPPLHTIIQTLRAITQKKRGASKPEAVFLCNPNSPTGQVLTQDEVVSVVQEAKKKNVYVILDEAFMDYCEGSSMIPLIDHFANLLILRSFTKFYALPGLRLGMLVASARMIDRIRAVLPTWSVNILAQASGLAALQDKTFTSKSLNLIRRERAYMTRQLETFEGCHIYSSAANFLMIRLPSTFQASGLAKTLALEGVLIRDLSKVPGLSSRMIRIGIRTRKDNNRVLQHLSRLLKTRTS